MIVIKNLSKSFGSNQVLSDVNLEFEKGEVYGIVGKNGSGKTTLFRCLSGLEKHSGTVESEYDNLKNHLGLLETTPNILSRITGWEYLKLLCVARGIKTDDFETQNIFELPLNRYAETYSTGMKKKLALMAILLQKNDVYILDEPFNGVDIQSNIIIVELIKELKRLGRTVLVSSHIFSTLSDTCDQIILLDAGRIEKNVAPEKFAELECEMKEEIVREKLKTFDLA